MTFPAPSPIRLPDPPGKYPITLSTHQLGSGPPVVFCHGFPDLAFGWRNPLAAIAEAGFHAIAPDQRGYGGSSAPPAIEDDGIGELTGDLVGLLDALEIERAFFVAHDWGATENAGRGMATSLGSVVENSTSHRNGKIGFVGDDTTFRENLLVDNGGHVKRSFNAANVIDLGSNICDGGFVCTIRN